MGDETAEIENLNAALQVQEKNEKEGQKEEQKENDIGENLDQDDNKRSETKELSKKNPKEIENPSLSFDFHTLLLARIRKSSMKKSQRIAAKNPFWNENGVMIKDPDDFGVIVSNFKIK